jgi:hypothetical protein
MQMVVPMVELDKWLCRGENRMVAVVNNSVTVPHGAKATEQVMDLQRVSARQGLELNTASRLNGSTRVTVTVMDSSVL